MIQAISTVQNCDAIRSTHLQEVLLTLITASADVNYVNVMALLNDATRSCPPAESMRSARLVRHLRTPRVGPRRYTRIRCISS